MFKSLLKVDIKYRFKYSIQTSKNMLFVAYLQWQNQWFYVIDGKLIFFKYNEEFRKKRIGISLICIHLYMYIIRNVTWEVLLRESKYVIKKKVQVNWFCASQILIEISRNFLGRKMNSKYEFGGHWKLAVIILISFYINLLKSTEIDSEILIFKHR